MSFHEQLQVATGADPALMAVGLFMATAFVLWALTHLVDRPAREHGVAEPDDRSPDSSDLEIA